MKTAVGGSFEAAHKTSPGLALNNDVKASFPWGLKVFLTYCL